MKIGLCFRRLKDRYLENPFFGFVASLLIVVALLLIKFGSFAANHTIWAEDGNIFILNHEKWELALYGLPMLDICIYTQD
jgi:hypothetical protein